ncbi:MAG: NAD(P)/FAD-dependent oxidoreductase [Prevotella sp.]|nr:NAD(P)/FAD-dependent oxidoreductase [Prevotella sp.]
MTRPSALIIGAGVGGLFTGAILAKEGFCVTVVEKNATIGGGLQSFSRFGLTFDTGMHVVGGLGPEGNVRRICRYLGIEDRLQLMDVDDDCTDELYFAQDKATYRVAKGRTGFVESLSAYFPHQREALKNYVNAVFEMSDSVDLFNLRPGNGQISLFASDDSFLTAADDFIASYVSDNRLRSILAYMNPLYGGRAGQTPAYIHAIISSLYIKGATRFAGGSQHVANLLEEAIVQAGGSVVAGDGVREIVTNGQRHVECIRTESGREYRADTYISAIHPCSMLRLLSDEDVLPKAYRSRLDEIPNSHSAFTLNIKLREGAFHYINHSVYYMTRYDDVWNFSRTDRPWPLGFLFMTPPEKEQGYYSRKAVITAPMPWQMVLPWQHTTIPGNRGADYEKWKEERAGELLGMACQMLPGMGSAVEQVNTASPLTIRDYYGVKEGSICGFSKDCRNIALSQLPVRTKIDNLLLTGQNNSLHGFCGVPLTAITTSEALLGSNFVLNKLNNNI